MLKMAPDSPSQSGRTHGFGQLDGGEVSGVKIQRTLLVPYETRRV